MLLFPIKLVALWLIQDGQATLGIGVIVAAKVLGTAFVGRLFILVEPQLMTFAWFARCAALVARDARPRHRRRLRRSAVVARRRGRCAGCRATLAATGCCLHRD